MKQTSFEVRNGPSTLPCDHCGHLIGLHSKVSRFCPDFLIDEEWLARELRWADWNGEEFQCIDSAAADTMLAEIKRLRKQQANPVITDLGSVTGKDSRPSWGGVFFLSGCVTGALIMWVSLGIRGAL